jgi:predicted ester cyclase
MPQSRDLEDRIRRLIRGVWNGEDPSVADELVADEFTLPDEDELPDDFTGPNLYRGIAESTQDAFDDLTYEIEDVLVDEHQVAVRWTMHGTHSGPLFGVAPSYEEVEVTGIEIDRFEGGKLVASWIQTDEKDILEQIGGLRPI